MPQIKDSTFLNLRGMILSRYKSLKSYAEALDWSQTKLSNKIDNPGSITLDEGKLMAEKLGVKLDEQTLNIFLAMPSGKTRL